MIVVDTRATAIAAVKRLKKRLPWLAGVEVELHDDSLGEPAIFVQLVVKSGVWDLFEDGERLWKARDLVHEVLAGAGIDLWPYVEFMSADELDAAE